MTVEKNLNRWFKEKWVDVSRTGKDGKHPPCGRSKAKTSSKGYPKCRPSVKVSSKTPKTSGSMSTGQKRAATKRKRSKKQGVGGKPTIVKAMDEAWVFMKGGDDYPPCPTPHKNKYQSPAHAEPDRAYQSKQVGYRINTYPCVCGYHHLTRG
jgi:hypothetical protein